MLDPNKTKVFMVSHPWINRLAGFVARNKGDNYLSSLINVTIRDELRHDAGARDVLARTINELVLIVVMDAAMDFAIRDDAAGLFDYLINDPNLTHNVTIRSYQINAFLDDNQSVVHYEDYWSFFNTLSNNITRYIRYIISHNKEHYKECIFNIYEYFRNNFEHMPMASYSLVIARGRPCVLIEEPKHENENTGKRARFA